jgi:hypothetical protein
MLARIECRVFISLARKAGVITPPITGQDLVDVLSQPLVLGNTRILLGKPDTGERVGWILPDFSNLGLVPERELTDRVLGHTVLLGELLTGLLSGC